MQLGEPNSIPLNYNGTVNGIWLQFTYNIYVLNNVYYYQPFVLRWVEYVIFHLYHSADSQLFLHKKLHQWCHSKNKKEAKNDDKDMQDMHKESDVST